MTADARSMRDGRQEPPSLARRRRSPARRPPPREARALRRPHRARRWSLGTELHVPPAPRSLGEHRERARRARRDEGRPYRIRHPERARGRPRLPRRHPRRRRGDDAESALHRRRADEVLRRRQAAHRRHGGTLHGHDPDGGVRRGSRRARRGLLPRAPRARHRAARHRHRPGRPRGHAVLERDHRLPEGRDAHAPEPRRADRGPLGDAGRRRHPGCERPRRAAVLPHLRHRRVPHVRTHAGRDDHRDPTLRLRAVPRPRSPPRGSAPPRGAADPPRPRQVPRAARPPAPEGGARRRRR